jgi:hypothetical protein
MTVHAKGGIAHAYTTQDFISDVKGEADFPHVDVDEQFNGFASSQ